MKKYLYPGLWILLLAIIVFCIWKSVWREEIGSNELDGNETSNEVVDVDENEIIPPEIEIEEDENVYDEPVYTGRVAVRFSDEEEQKSLLVPLREWEKGKYKEKFDYTVDDSEIIDYVLTEEDVKDINIDKRVRKEDKSSDEEYIENVLKSMNSKKK